MTDSVFKVNLGFHDAPQGFGRLVSALQRWRDRNAALREFERLDDHDLRDIGLDRYRLRAAVDEHLAARDLRVRC